MQKESVILFYVAYFIGLDVEKAQDQPQIHSIEKALPQATCPRLETEVPSTIGGSGDIRCCELGVGDAAGGAGLMQGQGLVL